MDFYKRALELREETISHRRWLHSNAEVGLHMPKGQTYVMEQLRGYGLDPHPCGHGVIAELGQEGGRTILLRADMDALPMPEESGESFSCPTGTEAHTCGVPFPVSWTVKMKKKQKETQDILSYHTQAAGCSDKARAKASGGRQPIEECGRTGL